MNTEELRAQLNEFDAGQRESALATLNASPPEVAAKGWINLHCHTFYSYNGYGYSPSAVAWAAKERGLEVVGIVDFDVLDAVDEFRAACAQLGIRGIAGIETRIFIPEFADKVINSPGEPGIAYHMGIGFTKNSDGDPGMLAKLKGIAQDRNKGIIERVNPVLDPVQVSYEDDLLPLAPNANPTERHLCEAYRKLAEKQFLNVDDRVAFWSEKLSTPADEIAAIIDNAPKLEGVIRAKTMKRGGVGYVQPDTSTFPTLQEFNDFVVAAGAIPTCAWLDGTTDGEKEMDRLLALQIDAGVEAINIVPDRNWNIADPDVKAKKVAELDRVIALARSHDLPIAVGTEMNAPGLPHVDNFDAPELAPYLDVFNESAHIFYGHTIAQESAGMGYASDWAKRNFDIRAVKNDFYAQLGRAHTPGKTVDIDASMNPDALLSAITS